MWKRFGLCVTILILSCIAALPAARAADGAGRWTLMPPLREPRVAHTATLLPDGQVLVVGGETPDPSGIDNLVLASVERLDPVAEQWSIAAPMNTPREGHTATRLRDGRVLVVGGFGPQATQASAEIFDPNANTWSAAGALAEARGDHTATLLADGRVLVAGGKTGRSRTDLPRASAELYDPATNHWSRAAALAGTRYAHAAALLADGRVLVAGGVSNRSDAPLASVEVYDPQANRWQQAAPMPRWRFDLSLVVLPDGTALAFGGDELDKRSETYDPRTDKWVESGSTQAQHLKAIALPLPDGRILAVDATSEVYDPASRSWATIATSHVPRGRAAAVTLPSGQAVMIGGLQPSDGGSTISGTVERYDPTGVFPGLPQTGGGWGINSGWSRLAILRAALVGFAVIGLGAAMGTVGLKHSRRRSR